MNDRFFVHAVTHLEEHNRLHGMAGGGSFVTLSAVLCMARTAGYDLDAATRLAIRAINATHKDENSTLIAACGWGGCVATVKAAYKWQ